jgi:hypothetical protein
MQCIVDLIMDLFAADPSTACDQCTAGHFSPGGGTTCVTCPAGFIDHDADPATACGHNETWDESGFSWHCDTGTYAAAGSTSCDSCSTGFADLDSNPATGELAELRSYP